MKQVTELWEERDERPTHIHDMRPRAEHDDDLTVLATVPKNLFTCPICGGYLQDIGDGKRTCYDDCVTFEEGMFDADSEYEGVS